MATCLGQARAAVDEEVEALNQVNARISGRWVNANYDGILTIFSSNQTDLQKKRFGLTGSYGEAKRDRTSVDDGQWSFGEDGRGSFRSTKVGVLSGVLAGRDLLALQPLRRGNVLHGDGMVLYRDGFDFEGLSCATLDDPDGARKKQLVGRWTHPLLPAEHEVEAGDLGRWVVRNKAGGMEQGELSVLSDHSFRVKLPNRWTYRVWLVANASLVNPARNERHLLILVFEPSGEMNGDGWVLAKK